MDFMQRSLVMTLEQSLDIEIEFIINKQIEHLDDATMIDAWAMPPLFEKSVRFIGSYGIDGDIYGYYDLSFNKIGELVKDRLGMDVDEAKEKILPVYGFSPRSWR
jgi:hypothetical protein